MKILSIESSCDETGAAVVEKKNGKIHALSNVLATSSQLHAKTGGIIPENAAREQIRYIIPVIVKTLVESKSSGGTGGKDHDMRAGEQSEKSADGKENPELGPHKWEEAKKILEEEIDAIAVTYGPGLIGSLLIGVETAKTLSFVFRKPIIPVNHLLAHIYANYIDTSISSKLKAINFPYIGLIVSGGHTDLLYFKSHTNYKWLGGTRDDAAGEALDKIGRMLGLSYPAGAEMEKRANKFLTLQTKISKLKAQFQSPLLHSDDFDFSFSGLKTEVMRFVKNSSLTGSAERGERLRDPRSSNEALINQICYATQKAVIDVLIKKTIKATKVYNCETILLGGGVSANKKLIEEFRQSVISHKSSVKILAPKREFATDNAAMIGSYALLNYKPVAWKKIQSDPELYFG